MSILGPSKQEVWRALCQEANCELIHSPLWNGVKVVKRVSSWNIILDTAKLPPGPNKGTMYTRIRTPFITKDNFSFIISRKNSITSMLKRFVKNNQVVVDKEFYQYFTTQSNNTVKLHLLLDNSKILQIIKNQPEIEFGIRTKVNWFGQELSEGICEIYFQVTGIHH